MDWSKVTSNGKVVELLKEREKLEEQIRDLDNKALMKYEIEMLNEITDDIDGIRDKSNNTSLG